MEMMFGRASDNHETLYNCANYSHQNPTAKSALASDENAQWKLFRRRFKSCTDIGRSKIDRKESAMGVRVSRSQSADSILKPTNSFVYEPLSRVSVLVNDCQAEIDDDDYYQLLNSSTDEDNDFVNCRQSNQDDNNELSDGQKHDNADENSCTTITTSTNEHTPQLNGSVNCSVIRKFSTLPRAKSHERVARRCSEVRKSCKISIERANCSNESVSQEPNSLVKEENKAINGTVQVCDVSEAQRGDKVNRVDLFQSTTLPKVRSRASEQNIRHSFRNCSAEHMECARNRLSDLSGSGGSTSKTPESCSSRVKRSRSNLSWLRKSMKKLNPFQMPQESISIQPSTSFSANDTHDECKKENCSDDVSATTTNETVQNDNSDPQNPDIFNIVLQDQQQLNDSTETRPRQYGRRSNPIRIAESVNHAAARIVSHHQNRPSSAPTSSQRNSHRPRQSLPSETSSIASSRNSSPVSIVSSTGSSSIPDPIVERNLRFSANHISDEDERDQGENSSESKTVWPHLLSRPICTLFCTLGLFNISRFAIFSVHFGANFLVQFLLLSFIFGIPFLWLQIVLGYKIKGGIVTMFRITPICKGIGISLMISHCIVCLYSSVSTAWVLIYLRDSAISSDKHYSWEERFDSYRGFQNISALRLSENIADYFNGVVLQRLSGLANTHDGKMRFQLAFSVAIVWILVFIMLSRGIRSLGKLMIGICLFSFLGLAAVCIKFLTLLNLESVQDIFPATDWQEFFANSNSWSVAAQETFLTWGLLGVSTYTMYCKSGKNQSTNHSILRREALLIVFLTLFGLFLGAVLGSTCWQILKLNSFNYFPASFENPKNDIFLWPMHYASLPSFHHSIPSKWITRYSSVIGESFERPIFVNQQGIQVFKESGYKPIRLITEILPSTLAISSQIEPFWGFIAFLCLFLLGLGQLSVMWKPISGVVGSGTSAILLSCVTGLFLGVPLTTDIGIVVVHFMDYVFGGTWFLPIIWTAYLLAIFMVRGRPFTSDVLVRELRFAETLSAFVAFSWNVLLPIGLILLSVLEYKKSHSNELFHQRNVPSMSHLSNWPLWTKQLGGLLQVSFLILLPSIAILQIYIYLSKGPRDILERIERLFRPPLDSAGDPALSHLPIHRLCTTNLSQNQTVNFPISENNAINDAPPKYSPPPSYGKAMGLRVAAKMVRNSIRRSVRRFRRSEGNANIPTVSSAVSSQPNEIQNSEVTSTSFNLQQFFRSSFRARFSGNQSTEQLVLAEMNPETSSNV